MVMLQGPGSARLLRATVWWIVPSNLESLLERVGEGKCADKIVMTPLRRIGKPFEAAFGVFVLASEEASFIAGIVIDGGFIAQ